MNGTELASTPEFSTVKVQLAPSTVSPITNVGLEPEPEPVGISAARAAPAPVPSKSTENPVASASAVDTADFATVPTHLSVPSTWAQAQVTVTEVPPSVVVVKPLESRAEPVEFSTVKTQSAPPMSRSVTTNVGIVPEPVGSH